MSLRDSIHWDRQFEEGLPDSRLSGSNREKTTVYHGRMECEKIFCADCGIYAGLVTAYWTPHIFYLCNDCALKRPNLIEVPAPPGVTLG